MWTLNVMNLINDKLATSCQRKGVITIEDNRHWQIQLCVKGKREIDLSWFCQLEPANLKTILIKIFFFPLQRKLKRPLCYRDLTVSDMLLAMLQLLRKYLMPEAFSNIMVNA